MPAPSLAPTVAQQPVASKATLTDAGIRRDIFGLDKKSALTPPKNISQNESENALKYFRYTEAYTIQFY